MRGSPAMRLRAIAGTRHRVVGVMLAAGATAMALVPVAGAAPGDISTVAGNGVQGYNGDGIAATMAELNLPPAAIARPDGDILIPDFGNNRVREVLASGTIQTVAGNGMFG